MAAADGTFLGYTNNRASSHVLRMLEEAVTQHTPAISGTPFPGQNSSLVKSDPQFSPQPPIGGMVVRVQAKVLGGYDEPDTHFQKVFQTALSRDNLWITANETQALIAGSFPDSLAIRIARFHLVDNTRGEPPMWNEDEVISYQFTVKQRRILGHVELKSKDGSRSYSVDLLGQLTVAGPKVTGIKMVAKGTFAGEGPYTRNAPKDPFPLAISFTLADGSDIADSIPPQGSRGWLRGYIQ